MWLRIDVTDMLNGICADNLGKGALYVPDDTESLQTVTVLAGTVGPLRIGGVTHYPDQAVAIVVRTTLNGSEKTCSAEVSPIPGPRDAFRYNLMSLGPTSELDETTAEIDSWILSMLLRTEFDGGMAQYIRDSMFYRSEYSIGGVVTQIVLEHLPDQPGQ